VLGRILLTFGGVLVVALFAALLAPFFIDWTDFRVEFEQRASRILGKKVTVHGEVEARILPFPSVTLSDVRVGQDQDGQPQVSAARFSMDMELAPFLSGEARIFDMRIEDPKARVRVLPDGTLDWMRGSRADIPLRTVVIEDVHITGGSIDLIDEQSGQTRRLTGLSADLSAGSLAGPWRGDGFASLDGEEAAFSLSTGEADRIEQKVPLRLRLLPDSAPIALTLDGDLALSEDRPGYNGSFALDVLQEESEDEPVNAPPPGPRLKGGFELTNERIRIPEYRLEVGALNDPYVVTGEATLDTGQAPEFLLTADGQQIDVNRLGTGERAKTGRDAAASAQRRIQAVIDIAAQIPIPQVPGRASLRLPAVVANDTTVRDIRIDVRPAGSGWTVENFAATLPGRTQVEAKGALTLENRIGFVGDMLLASNQPSGLADWLSGTVDPAIRQLKTAGFSARVNLTPQLQRFEDLELAIGPATLRGSVERHAPPEAVPSLTLDLAGDEIDLDAMRALASLITGDDAGEDVLDHTVAANLKAERFTAFGVAADRVDTVFTLSEGQLSLERLSIGDLAGAAIAAQGNLNGSFFSYAGAGSATLKAEDPSAFLAMLRNRLPSHPILDRMAASAGWFTGTDLTANITVGGEISGASARVTGTANGSTIEAEIALPTLFDLTAGGDFSLNALLTNEQSPILLGQAGLDPLPLGDDGPGRLSLALNREGDQPATGSLAFDTDATQFETNGSLSLASEDFGSGRGRISLRSRDIEHSRFLRRYYPSQRQPHHRGRRRCLAGRADCRPARHVERRGQWHLPEPPDGGERRSVFARLGKRRCAGRQRTAERNSFGRGHCPVTRRADGGAQRLRRTAVCRPFGAGHLAHGLAGHPGGGRSAGGRYHGGAGAPDRRAADPQRRAFARNGRRAVHDHRRRGEGAEHRCRRRGCQAVGRGEGRSPRGDAPRRTGRSLCGG